MRLFCARSLRIVHFAETDACSGSIIYRQRGTKIFPGTNVRKAKDDTLYTTVSGVVKFERLGKNKTQASCYPVNN